MRKFLVLLALTFAMASVSQGYEIVWRTLAGGDRLFMDQALTTPVPGAPFGAPQNPDLGGFVQLVFLGSDGIFQSQDHTSWDTVNGLNSSSDDEIVAYAFVGKGFLLNTAGEFQATSSGVTAGLDGDGAVINKMDFVIRFFDNPSPNYQAGDVSTWGSVPTSGEYGYAYASAGGAYFQATAIGDTDNNNFFISNSFYTNLGPIPEPGTVALFAIGAVTLALRRRLKK